MAKKAHKDVEFVVLDFGGKERVFKKFDEAAGFAATMSVSDGMWQTIRVSINSVAGARWWGGDYAVEMYREDPEASFADLIRIKATSEGRMP